MKWDEAKPSKQTNQKMEGLGKVGLFQTQPHPKPSKNQTPQRKSTHTHTHTHNQRDKKASLGTLNLPIWARINFPRWYNTQTPVYAQKYKYKYI